MRFMTARQAAFGKTGAVFLLCGAKPCRIVLKKGKRCAIIYMYACRSGGMERKTVRSDNMNNEYYDCLVVGAGPAGIFTALELTRLNKDAILTAAAAPRGLRENAYTASPAR